MTGQPTASAGTSGAGDAGASARVVLVRHGRTAVNAQARLSGRHEAQLDELGRAQAVAAGRAAAAMVNDPQAGPVVVVSSPLQRCSQSAQGVLDALGPAAGGLHVDDRFVEMDYGEWDGRPLAEVPADAWRRWRRDPDFAPPGGETLAAVRTRVADGLQDWARRAGGGTVVVVSHVSPIKAAVCWALGVGDEAAWRMRLDNASVTHLEVVDGRGSLHAFNLTAHLDGLA